jgi:hypothetical protein
MIGWMAGAIYGEGKYLWQGVHRWCKEVAGVMDAIMNDT